MLTELHLQWYSKVKIIPESLINENLTEFALAVWFCDDGCSSGSASLYTMSFSDREVKFLSSLLKSRFDLSGSILKNKDNQPFIRFDANSKRKLNKMLSKFSIPGMEYKLDF